MKQSEAPNAAESEETPPPFEPTNVVDLVSIEASKIAKVSLYSHRAEITRVYKFAVKTGLNQLNILGLPNVLEEESVRVEGRGPATIHDVTLAWMPAEPVPTTSELLESLIEKEEVARKALERAKRTLLSLETYLSTLNAQHNKASDLKDVMSEYDDTAAIWDSKVSKLEKELVQLEKDIKAEKERLGGPKGKDQLRMKASVGVFADAGGDVEIILIYAVREAGWRAGYDIRAEMDAKEKPITLIYKAIIVQNTGENWEDIPLTLETATPLFGIGIPNLRPWYLSFRERVQLLPAPVVIQGTQPLVPTSASYSISSIPVPFAPLMPPGAPPMRPSVPPMWDRELSVSSKGNVSATFRVPGIITIPSDGSSHNFTIVKLTLEATMTWISVPKQDAKVHIKAKIHNSSEYAFLPGQGSVYVDGSFIARSEVPAVSPQESFDCSLGLDPSIRITYHPLSKKLTESGIYTKTANHTFVQRIQVHNTKTVPVGHLKVIDQVPVSQNSNLNVKLVNPALKIPNPKTTSIKITNAASLFPPLKVSDGVIAQWEGTDDPDCDLEAIGKDGKLNWVASVPAQGKVNFTLQWEVSSPAKEKLVGL